MAERSRVNVGAPLDAIDDADRLSAAELRELTGFDAGRAVARAVSGAFVKPRRVAPGVWAWSRSAVLAWLAEHGQPKRGTPAEAQH